MAIGKQWPGDLFRQLPHVGGNHLRTAEWQHEVDESTLGWVDLGAIFVPKLEVGQGWAPVRTAWKHQESESVPEQALAVSLTQF